MRVIYISKRELICSGREGEKKNVEHKSEDAIWFFTI